MLLSVIKLMPKGALPGRKKGLDLVEGATGLLYRAAWCSDMVAEVDRKNSCNLTVQRLRRFQRFSRGYCS